MNSPFLKEGVIFSYLTLILLLGMMRVAIMGRDPSIGCKIIIIKYKIL